MNKRTSQINSLGKGPHEGRVAAVAGPQPRRRGDARPLLVWVTALCRGSSLLRACVRRRCLPPLDVSCSLGLQPPQGDGRFSRWWNVLYLFAREMTKGGRAMVRPQGVRRQRSSPHRPLPPHVLQLPGACHRISRCALEMLSCTMHFDSRSPGDTCISSESSRRELRTKDVV